MLMLLAHDGYGQRLEANLVLRIFCLGLPPIKKVMGGNLIDRSIGFGYGDRASCNRISIVSEIAWRRYSPRCASIGISGASNDRRGR
jgi:hypothetical protein